MTSSNAQRIALPTCPACGSVNCRKRSSRKVCHRDGQVAFVNAWIDCRNCGQRFRVVYFRPSRKSATTDVGHNNEAYSHGQPRR